MNNKRWRKILGLPPESTEIKDYEWLTLGVIRNRFNEFLFLDFSKLKILWKEFSETKSAGWLTESEETLLEFKEWCDEKV